MPRDAALAAVHARTVAAASKEDSRLLIELEYDDDEKLVNLHWSHVGCAGFSIEALAKLHSDGQILRLKRLREAAAAGKISVNDQCPCGSGKKYKKCCRA